MVVVIFPHISATVKIPAPNAGRPRGPPQNSPQSSSITGSTTSTCKRVCRFGWREHVDTSTPEAPLYNVVHHCKTAQSPSISHCSGCAAKQHASGCAATEHASNAHRPHHSTRLRRYACNMFMVFEGGCTRSIPLSTLRIASSKSSSMPHPGGGANPQLANQTPGGSPMDGQSSCKALYARGSAGFSVPLQRHRMSSGWRLISGRSARS